MIAYIFVWNLSDAIGVFFFGIVLLCVLYLVIVYLWARFVNFIKNRFKRKK